MLTVREHLEAILEDDKRVQSVSDPKEIYGAFADFVDRAVEHVEAAIAILNESHLALGINHPDIVDYTEWRLISDPERVTH